MNQNVQKLVLARFSALYGAPQAENAEAFVGEYHRALKGYTSDALTFAADRVISRNTYRAWPTVGECVEAANACPSPRSQAHFEPTPDKVVTNLTPEQLAEMEARNARVQALVDGFKRQVAVENAMPKARARA